MSVMREVVRLYKKRSHEFMPSDARARTEIRRAQQDGVWDRVQIALYFKPQDVSSYGEIKETC